MKNLGLGFILALFACESTAKPDIRLPDVGRAVRYSLEGELDPGLPRFDVVEVSGTKVRLREGLCKEGEQGSWVDWRTVRSWEDAGLALGDDRYLGMPWYPEY